MKRKHHEVRTPLFILVFKKLSIVKPMDLAQVLSGTALARLALVPETSTPAELAARIRSETAKWAGVIKDAGIRADD